MLNKAIQLINQIFQILIASVLLFPNLAGAQQPIHFSAAIGYDFFNQYWPCYDITLLVNNSWGLRYSEVSDITFISTINVDQTINQIDIKGDIQLPYFLKTLDFTSFREGTNQVFDFLTAYWGLGYNNLELTVIQREYAANSNSIQKTKREDTVSTSVTALTFGLYGGDRFLVIDFRLVYFKGTIPSSELIDKQEFDKWMLSVSFGIAYY